MKSVMFECQEISDSELRRRILGLLLPFGFLLLLLGFVGTQISQAQATNEEGNQPPYQQTGQGTEQQSDEMQDQLNVQAPDRLEGQTSSQQSDLTTNQQRGQALSQQPSTESSQESGEIPYRQSGQARYQQSGQESSQPTMSAEQIIGILEQEPVILARVKNSVAQQSGMDPSTISDESLYERIRQSETLRALATGELTMRGYSIDHTAPGSVDQSPPGTRSARGQIARRYPTQSPPYESPDSPQVQQLRSPYRNLPSLSDLYTQFPASRTKLRRFGGEAFLTGTGNANELPMDLPAGPDYVLGPGDNLTINMWGGRSGRLSRIVDRQGQIELPEAGTVSLNGMTIAHAQDAIQRLLDTQFHEEHVEISLGRVHTVRVYVVGDVQRPGAYDVSSLSTPLNALYVAGGPTSRGSLRILRQFRANQLVREVDLYDFLLRGMRAADDRLLPGDTILVPPVGQQISIEGMVRRPAIYELNGEQGLDQVLDLAGGVLVSANLKQINVERIQAHQSRTMFSLELPDDRAGMAEKLAAFKVQDGDDVVITQIQPYNEQAVYLEGHVLHPGKYPYRDGMTVSDLLRSYQDVMPEPSDHVELIRLQAPDFRPETVSFSLADALIGNDSILLHPFDLIRVYGRYEIDAPTVSIEGEVLRPGSYPMPKGMTVSGLVRMAGGFRRSAYRDEADLASYNVQDGKRVLVVHTDVAVQKALQGDKSADAPLKPGDVVSIRRLAGWQDIGASVTVNGEVEHAGTYGIEDGERLSAVLKRAGGFRKDAYPYAAILQRVQVRELGEQARQQMIQRIQETPVQVRQGTLSSQSATDAQQSLQSQRQEILRTLRNRPASGRVVIDISSDISKWENTSADIELRAGDMLLIPKRPNFVSISGQVYNPVAISYSPGRNLGWYLRKAGGATPSGNKKEIYVLRADGSVVPRRTGWMNSSFTELRMRPGDTIFVPEKIVGGSLIWQNILSTAQVMSAVTLPLAVGGVL